MCKFSVLRLKHDNVVCFLPLQI